MTASQWAYALVENAKTKLPPDEPEFREIMRAYQHGEMSLNEALAAVDKLKEKERDRDNAAREPLSQ